MDKIRNSKVQWGRLHYSAPTSEIGRAEAQQYYVIEWHKQGGVVWPRHQTLGTSILLPGISKFRRIPTTQIMAYFLNTHHGIEKFNNMKRICSINVSQARITLSSSRKGHVRLRNHQAVGSENTGPTCYSSSGVFSAGPITIASLGAVPACGRCLREPCRPPPTTSHLATLHHLADKPRSPKHTRCSSLAFTPTIQSSRP